MTSCGSSGSPAFSSPDTISVKWLRTKVTCASGGIHLAHLLPSALTPATKGQLRPAQQESKAIT